jgi:Polyketide cyclase / dehydrase and lipid transport
MFRRFLGSKLFCALLTILLVLPPELLAIKFAAIRGSYGALLFLGIPLSLGFVSVLLYEKLAGPHAAGGISVALLATLLCGSFLLVAGWEGIVCLLIVFIIATPFSLLGAAAAILLLRLRRTRMMAACVVLLMPVLAPQERSWHGGPEQFTVQTSIEIAAPPEKVWPLVVEFPLITEPPSAALFRAGVAYPLETKISGSGVGVTRECIFTTGTAEEVVDIWDQPHRLHFNVLKQPALMHESSWVPDLQTEHIKSEYVRSRAGQFDLIALPNGHTLLQGTSWYELKYWPSSYWRLWTDAIVHRIHTRVLEHIKLEAEKS